MGRDDRGRPIIISEEREPLAAVVTDGKYKLEAAGSDVGWIDTGTLTILFLDFVEVDQGEIFEVRGDEWLADGEQFDHRSPFGTARGGSEITVSREEVSN